MSTPQTLMERLPTADAQQNSPEAMLERLVEFQPQGAPVISLYLDARVNEHGKRDFAPFVRKRMAEVKRTFAPHSPERNSFTEDCVRIDRYLEDEPRQSAQGIAIFACSAANDFFDVGQFDAPFERNRMTVSDRPHLYPLARLSSQNPRYAVLLADTNSAHIFVFAARRTVDRRDVQNVDTREQHWDGLKHNRFQRHVEDFELRHAKEVIEVLERTMRDDQIDKVILAGDHETINPLLREQMSKELAAKVIDFMALGIDTPEHQILEESLTALRRHNSLSDMDKVQRLMNEYRADDLAVVGVTQTLAALSNGQVEELLISAKADDLVFDTAEAENVLKLHHVDDRPLPQLDQRSLADELVRQAQQASSARVTFIEDAQRLKDVGGVGALLRYRISAEHATPYDESAAVARTEALVPAT
jgi:peptide subunit release factor 1 (eRF1)